HALENDRERQPLPEDGAHRREPDRERDRHPEQQQHGERNAEDRQCHAGLTSSPRQSAMTCSTENSRISAPETTSGAWLNASEMPSVGILYDATDSSSIAPFHAMIAPKVPTSA